MKCIKCGAKANKSVHNYAGDYNPYRCSDSNCNHLFDLSEVKSENNVRKTRDGRIYMGVDLADPSYQSIRPSSNSAYSSYKNRGTVQHKTYNNTGNKNVKPAHIKIDNLIKIFGLRLVSIAYDIPSAINRDLGKCKSFSQLNRDEMSIVMFLSHINRASARRSNWRIYQEFLNNSNKSRMGILKVLENIDKYLIIYKDIQ